MSFDSLDWSFFQLEGYASFQCCDLRDLFLLFSLLLQGPTLLLLAWLLQECSPCWQQWLLSPPLLFVWNSSFLLHKSKNTYLNLCECYVSHTRPISPSLWKCLRQGTVTQTWIWCCLTSGTERFLYCSISFLDKEAC